MSRHHHQPPALLPTLSRGKHRSPRRGACFMEFASLLAGERWSDHPACTHPLLAAVARHVNDLTSEVGRARLVELIPSVIGLTGEDPHIDAAIALSSARLALPVAPAERQRVLAVGVLSCERVLADLDRRTLGELAEASRSALAQVPHAAGWAARFVSNAPTARLSAKRFRQQAAPTIVRTAAQGIAQACIPDPDGMLRDLLIGAIDTCATWTRRDSGPGATLDAAMWAAACQRTGGSTVAGADLVSSRPITRPRDPAGVARPSAG